MTVSSVRPLVSLAAASGVLLLLVAGGCEDFTPVDYRASELDASFADVSAPDSAAAEACRACVTSDTGACRPQYDTCAAFAPCKALIDCVLELDCLRQVSPDTQTPGALPPCSLGCLEQANTSINEILAPAFGLFSCMSTAGNCRSVCFDVDRDDDDG